MGYRIRDMFKNNIDYSKIRESLDNNFINTLNAIFNNLKNLLNNCNNEDKEKIDKLFSLIEDVAYEMDNDKNKRIIVNCLNLKEHIDSSNNNFLLRIDKLLNNICYENTEQYKIDIMNFFNYLIYEDKNIINLKTFLNNLNKEFYSSTYYDDVFTTLLYNFDSNDINDRNYYYKVSIMLLDKMSSNLLTKNKEKYLLILDNLKVHDNYVNDLVKLLNGNYISDEELASRFDINFSFPYDCNDINIINRDKDIPNLRQLAITIDNENTVKRDDSIYFKRNKDNTYTLYVHVSYIPAIIPYGSIIEETARKRNESVCVFNNVIPIYPNDLVLDKFSLDKGKYKNTVTYSLKVDKDLRIIPDTLKITRTNVRIYDNYSYSGINSTLMSNYDNELTKMLRYLTIFTYNNINNNDLDVEKLISDKEFYKELLVNVGDKNIAQEMIQFLMKTINYSSAKYFKDRELPFLYKYNYFDDNKNSLLKSAVSDNLAIKRDKKILNELEQNFLKIRFSDKPKQFFEYDCYSSSTDPLWRYASSYNQYLIDKFVFDKGYSRDLKDEWCDNTKRLAEELNLRKEMNKDAEIVCKRLTRIRKKH